MNENLHKNMLKTGIITGLIAGKRHYEATGDKSFAAGAAVRGGAIGYVGHLIIVAYTGIIGLGMLTAYLWSWGPISDAKWENARGGNVPITSEMLFLKYGLLTLLIAFAATVAFTWYRWGAAGLTRAYDEIVARDYQSHPREDRPYEARVRHLSSAKLASNMIVWPTVVAVGGGILLTVLYTGVQDAFTLWFLNVLYLLTLAGIAWWGLGKLTGNPAPRWVSRTTGLFVLFVAMNYVATIPFYASYGGPVNPPTVQYASRELVQLPDGEWVSPGPTKGDRNVSGVFIPGGEWPGLETWGVYGEWEEFDPLPSSEPQPSGPPITTKIVAGGVTAFVAYKTRRKPEQSSNVAVIA